MTEETIMDRIREQIAKDREATPVLHDRATDLGLHPQPWWDRNFYEHAILTKERLTREKGEQYENVSV